MEWIDLQETFRFHFNWSPNAVETGIEISRSTMRVKYLDVDFNLRDGLKASFPSLLFLS